MTESVGTLLIQRRALLTAVCVGAATTVLQFTPEPLLIQDPLEPHSTEMATNTLIDMALVNLINDNFAKELREFTSADGVAFVSWHDDLSFASVHFRNGTSRAFQRIHAIIDEATGGKVVAFQEVGVDAFRRVHEDDKTRRFDAVRNAPIRVLFPGRSDTRDAVGKLDNAAASVILQGKRSPQIRFVEEYIVATLIPFLAKVRADSLFWPEVAIFGHSLGGPNALHAKYLLEHNAYVGKCVAVVFEPFALAGEAAWILNDAKRLNASLDKGRFVEKLARNVSTIRSKPSTFIAGLYLNNCVQNMAFGESFYRIDHSYFSNPEICGKAAGVTLWVMIGGLAHIMYRYCSGRRKRCIDTVDGKSTGYVMSRRALVFGAATVTSACSANTLVWGMGKCVQSEVDVFHDTAANARVLYACGNDAMTKCKNTMSPKIEDLESPTDKVSFRPDLRCLRLVAEWETARSSM